MKVSIRCVTPEVAKKWLGTNINKQRNIIYPRLEFYERQMRDGKWRQNGESVIFDKNGNLIDGQHRLTAMVNSGVTIKEMVVVTEVDPDAFSTIDSGVSRGSKTVCEIEGIPNATAVSAIARAVVLYNKIMVFPGFNPTGRSSDGMVTNEEIRECVEKYKDIAIIASNVSAMKGVKKIISPSHAGFFKWLIIEDQKDMVDLMFDQISSGENLTKKDPVYHLRKRILEVSRSATVPASCRWVFLVKTWNDLCQSRETPFLRWTESESIPVPLFSRKPEVSNANT